MRPLLLGALALSSCACRGGSARTDSVGAPSASIVASPVDASGAASIDTPPPLFTADAWTEPAAIDALALSCRAAPARQWLTCERYPREGDQVFPCIATRNECTRSCSAACDECAATCSQSCDSCKATCAVGPGGDGCRRACAGTMGACRQACDGVLGRCPCPSADACEVDEARKWKAAGCTRRCEAIRLYLGNCMKDRGGSNCMEETERRWPACNVHYCIFGNEPTAKP